VKSHSKTWPPLEAKAKFSELFRRVQTEGLQMVTVHGEPAVVVSKAPVDLLIATLPFFCLRCRNTQTPHWRTFQLCLYHRSFELTYFLPLHKGDGILTRTRLSEMSQFKPPLVLNPPQFPVRFKTHDRQKRRQTKIHDHVFVAHLVWHITIGAG
jgi:prevent-host-death family protein